MRKLKFTGGKRAMKKLSRVQRSIDKFTKSHKGTLSKRNHSTLKRLLKKEPEHYQRPQVCKFTPSLTNNMPER